MDGECWLCDGKIKAQEGTLVRSLGIAVHRRCLDADLQPPAPTLVDDELDRRLYTQAGWES
jgi:hypothetical protein